MKKNLQFINWGGLAEFMKGKVLAQDQRPIPAIAGITASLHRDALDQLFPMTSGSIK